MALKFKYKSKEEVPAEVQGLYVERDGALVTDRKLVFSRPPVLSAARVKENWFWVSPSMARP